MYQQTGIKSKLGSISPDLQDDGCVQHQPDVHAAMDRLARLLQALDGIADTISDRLAPVMVPDTPSDMKAAEPQKPIGSPLAGRIDVLCDQIEASMNMLGNVICRLEI